MENIKASDVVLSSIQIGEILDHNKQNIASARNLYMEMKNSEGKKGDDKLPTRVNDALKCIFMEPSGASLVRYSFLDESGTKTDEEMEREFEKVHGILSARIDFKRLREINEEKLSYDYLPWFDGDVDKLSGRIISTLNEAGANFADLSPNIVYTEATARHAFFKIVDEKRQLVQEAQKAKEEKQKLMNAEEAPVPPTSAGIRGAVREVLRRHLSF